MYRFMKMIEKLLYRDPKRETELLVFYGGWQEIEVHSRVNKYTFSLITLICWAIHQYRRIWMHWPPSIVDVI